ncbi:MAG: excisionase family DNA binding protein [Rubritalea sp.]|jgi:excisionase family DNA binding protein
MNQKNYPKEHLLTLDEVAKRLSLSKRAVYRLIAKKSLPRPVKVGGATRLYESDLEQFFINLKSCRK